MGIVRVNCDNYNPKPYGYSWVTGNLETVSGTSFSAPHVVGVAALMLAKDSKLTGAEMKQKLIDSVDKKDALKNKVKSGGRLNAYRALKTLKRYVYLGGWYDGNKRFKDLRGIAVADKWGKKKVYVVDAGSNRIKIGTNFKWGFLPTKWDSWGKKGTGPGQFSTPHDVAVDNQSWVYVSDSGNHRVQRFSSYGGYLAQTMGPNVLVKNPKGVGGGKKGTVHLADSSGKFSIFDSLLLATGNPLSSDLKYVHGYTPLNQNGCCFKFPKPIDVAKNTNTSEIYTLDGENQLVTRILAIGSDHKILEQWGGHGDEAGKFKGASSIAIDSEGNVIVADTDNHRVQIFDKTGMPLTEIGKKGSNSGEFIKPRAVSHR